MGAWPPCRELAGPAPAHPPRTALQHRARRAESCQALSKEGFSQLSQSSSPGCPRHETVI